MRQYNQLERTINHIDLLNLCNKGEISLLIQENHSCIHDIYDYSEREYIVQNREFEVATSHQKKLLNSHGYDLCIGRIRLNHQINWSDISDQFINLRPGDFVEIETYQRIKLPRYIFGEVSSLARNTLLGLSHISTTIHPGWGEHNTEHDGFQSHKKGVPIRLGIANIGNHPIQLFRNQPICRVVFFSFNQCVKLNPPMLDSVIEPHEKILKNYNNIYFFVGILLILGVAHFTWELVLVLRSINRFPFSEILIVTLGTIGISSIFNRYGLKSLWINMIQRFAFNLNKMYTLALICLIFIFVGSSLFFIEFINNKRNENLFRFISELITRLFKDPQYNEYIFAALNLISLLFILSSSIWINNLLSKSRNSK